jgi:SET domain-containing protein
MTQALALGLGSMFNHSTRAQNVGWKRNTDTDVIVYTTLRNIKAGEELCISYGNARLWFKDADVEAYDDSDDDTGGGTKAEIELSGLGKLDL